MAKLAVALDSLDVEQVAGWARTLSAEVDVLKLGLEFYLRHGSVGVLQVRRAAPDCALFLDLKLHDIPATVAGGARAVKPLQPDYLTVHASGGIAMVSAAAEALPHSRITAVTVLTSLSADDLASMGVGQDPAALAESLALSAVGAGARAVVSSAHEVARIRSAVGPEPVLVTPGIRPAGADRGDQARVMTPAQASAAGSDLLVVGRPITQADDPVSVARRIRSEIV